MNVDERTAAARLAHAGKAYYFCSEACAKTFRADPEKFKTQANAG